MTVVEDARKDNATISELVAAADLIKRGHQVYRSLASTGVDLLILKDHNEVVRVEVTTGRRDFKRDAISYPLHNRTSGRWDIIAVVLDGKTVLYFNKNKESVEP